jgi:hypothetical protein
MHHPLPEVPKPSTSSRAKPAFLGLNVVAVVESILVLISCFLVIFAKSDPLIPVWVVQLISGFMLFLYAVVVYYLWRGYNWARWVTFVLCIQAFTSLLWPYTTSRFPEFERVYSNVGLVWSCGLAIWLLLPGVARHFKSPSSNTSNEINAG